MCGPQTSGGVGFDPKPPVTGSQLDPKPPGRPEAAGEGKQ